MDPEPARGAQSRGGPGKATGPNAGAGRLRVIGIYNIKGGVGKTAAAVNLAYLSAVGGYRTLLWDLNPQAAATYYFRIKGQVPGDSKALLRGKQGLGASIKGTDFEHLDLLPAEFSFRDMDLLLEEQKGPTKRLRRLLRPQSASYDHCLLDCPPSISLVSENVFRAADLLLVPTGPDHPVRPHPGPVAGFFAGSGAPPPSQGACVLLDGGPAQTAPSGAHGATSGALPGFLRASIPYTYEVERMGVHRLPLIAYAPSNPAADAYRALWSEVLTALAAPDGDDAGTDRPLGPAP